MQTTSTFNCLSCVRSRRFVHSL